MTDDHTFRPFPSLYTAIKMEGGVAKIPLVSMDDKKVWGMTMTGASTVIDHGSLADVKKWYVADAEGLGVYERDAVTDEWGDRRPLGDDEKGS